MKKMYDANECATLCNQLTYLYSSGTSLDKGLLLLKELDFIDLNAWLEIFNEKLQLSAVFEEDGKFPQYFVEAFSMAEKVGQEEKLCIQMAKHFKSQHELKSFLKDSLSLPMILLGIFAIILSLMAWSILPLFQHLFDQLGIAQTISLNLFLSGLKGFSVLLLVLFIVFFIWFILGLINHHNDPKGYPSWENRILCLFPKAQATTQLAFYTSMAHMALSGGIDNKLALSLVKGQSQDKRFDTLLEKAKRQLEPSEGLYELLLNNELYDSMELTTLRVAAKSGQLEKALENLSNDLNEKAQVILNQSLSKVEPWIITGLTVMVFAIVFAMIVPLLNVMSSLG